MTDPVSDPVTGTTLHIGCGEAAEWLDTPPEGPLVLVEPNPDCLEAIADSALRPDRVIRAALAETTGRAPFHVLNFADLSSLHPPEVLAGLFPGLRETARIEVETRTLEALIEEAGLEGSGHRLVIEAMGEEGPAACCPASPRSCCGWPAHRPIPAG